MFRARILRTLTGVVHKPVGYDDQAVYMIGHYDIAIQFDIAARLGDMTPLLARQLA